MASPFHAPPRLFPSRSKSTSGHKRGDSKLGTMLSATRAPSPAGRTRTTYTSTPRPRSVSPVSPIDESPLTRKIPFVNSFSAPPIWRAKFDKVKPLRRSRVKIGSSPLQIGSPVLLSTTNKGLQGYLSSDSSTISLDTTITDISLTSSTVEYDEADLVELVRPTVPPKLVDARGPLTTTPQKTARQEATHERKLREYFGVAPSDQDAVVKQRTVPTRKASMFREHFDTPEEARAGRRGLGIEGLPSIESSAVQRQSEDLSEGQMKWFRCELFPADAPAFHTAEAEAKRLVVKGGGQVMDQWTYVGGFMFKIPRTYRCPLPPKLPSGVPTALDELLLRNLGPGGHIHTTEFQIYMDPMQHILSMSPISQRSPRTPNTPNSGASTIRPSSQNDELLSAVEYLTSPSVEEIPLLRTSPAKSDLRAAAGLKPRSSWQDTQSPPEAKRRMELWLQKQQAPQQARKKRIGQVYEASGRRLRRIAEANEENEWESVDDDDGRSMDSGSEFSMETGLDSVKFVAECGGMF